MGNSVGPVRKLSFDNTDIYLTNDNEVNFWKGGWVNTEPLDDVGGATPKTEFRAGILSGLTQRCAKPGSLAALHTLIEKTTVGDVDIVAELNNGDKFSATCFATADPTAFFNNQDGKASFGLSPRKGVFNSIS